MFVLVRAVTYAALFIGIVLVYLPARFFSWSGIARPASTGAPQVAGIIIQTPRTGKPRHPKPLLKREDNFRV